jgi:magnesium chelatase family protein
LSRNSIIIFMSNCFIFLFYGNNYYDSERRGFMISKVNCISLMGIEGFIVEIEVDVQNGMPIFNMVGLPDIVVKESKERVRAAIKNSGYEFPISRIIVNFAPADIKKEGPHLDLSISIGILISSGAVKPLDLKSSIFIGELSLNGEVRGVRGLLPMILEAREKGMERAFIPSDNINEVITVEGLQIYPVSTLFELIDFLNGASPLGEIINEQLSPQIYSEGDMDFSEVKGQKLAKRAVEVAASGGHNVIMIGSPGGGKTMIAQRIPTILPFLIYKHAIEVTKIYSVAGMLKNNSNIIFKPPFRSPHHTASTVSIIGGGSNPLPGEVSLAHGGVLFLDELPEFRRDTLEALRQPMEDGSVSISRVKGKYVYPAKFMLVSSMNPCPCGYYGYQLKECKCSEVQIRNYLNKVSGPLLDRIDIHVNVEPVYFNDIHNDTNEETSESIKKRVLKSRMIQLDRFEKDDIYSNAEMKTRHMKKYCKLDAKGTMLLESAFKTMALSTRAYSKIIKIARTIADLNQSSNIEEDHIAEAIQYRSLDRKYWA